MEVTLNGERVECALSVHTLMLYETEFDGADLIADVSGKVMASDFVEDEDLVFDFTRVPWTKVMQAMWAMVKTVDDTLPHFDGWSKEITQLDSWEIRDVVNGAVNDAFFHSAAADGEVG